MHVYACLCSTITGAMKDGGIWALSLSFHDPLISNLLLPLCFRSSQGYQVSVPYTSWNLQTGAGRSRYNCKSSHWHRKNGNTLPHDSLSICIVFMLITSFNFICRTHGPSRYRHFTHTIRCYIYGLSFPVGICSTTYWEAGGFRGAEKKR